MVVVNNELQDLKFPVLLWRPDYVYLAHNAVELAASPRSLLTDTRRRAALGEWKLADASGTIYKIRDFTPVRAFGGLKAVPYLLLFSVFATPDKYDPQQIPLDEFKKTIIKALRGRYRRDLDGSPKLAEIADRIIASENYEEVLRAIPQRL